MLVFVTPPAVVAKVAGKVVLNSVVVRAAISGLIVPTHPETAGVITTAFLGTHLQEMLGSSASTLKVQTAPAATIHGKQRSESY